MIRINLHDYRYELRKIEIQKRVVKCAAIVLVAILLIALNWFMAQVRLDTVRSETNKLNAQVSALKAQFEKVKAMETRQRRVESIIVGIDGLREKQMPASTIIADLNLRVPKALWLSGIRQVGLAELERKKVPVIMFGDPAKKKKKREKKKNVKIPKEFIEVAGFSLTEEGVTKYMESLQTIPYYRTTFLYESLQKKFEDRVVYRFIIYCHMPGKDKKKSA